MMVRRVEFVTRTDLRVEGILGFMRRQVVRYGTGAAVICPKEFLGRTAYLVITREPWENDARTPARGRDKKKIGGASSR